MRNKAKKFKRETYVDKYSKRATCIKLKYAIGFQGESRYQTFGLRYLDHNNENSIIVKFNIYIPLYIYPCQIFSKYGTQVALNTQIFGGYKKNHMAAIININSSREILVVI